MKDHGWAEDKHYLRRGESVFVVMTNTVLSLLQLMKKPGESVQEVTEEVHYSPRKVLRFLGIYKM